MLIKNLQFQLNSAAKRVHDNIPFNQNIYLSFRESKFEYN